MQDVEQATHTPGPWKVYIGPMDMEGGLNPFFRGIVALLKNSGEGDEVAVILDRNEAAHDYEANARLIAAAPELLDALKGLRSLLLVQNDDTEGFVVCMGCGMHCDPQDFETYGGIEHERTEDFTCPVEMAEQTIAQATGVQS